MPIVIVPMDMSARAAYFEVYKQQAIDRVNEHMRLYWERFQVLAPWYPMVALHRAVEAQAFLNDPDGEANLDARYPTVKAGIPSYGATYAAVAMQYVENNRGITWEISNVFENHRHTVAGIPIRTEKVEVDHLVNTFITQHPPGGWT